MTSGYGVEDPAIKHYTLVISYTTVHSSLEVLHGVLHPEVHGN